MSAGGKSVPASCAQAVVANSTEAASSQRTVGGLPQSPLTSHMKRPPLMTLRSFLTEVRTHAVAAGRPVVGLTAEQLARLEAELKVRLPAAFRDVLTELGTQHNPLKLEL